MATAQKKKFDKREYQREYMARQTAMSRDITIPKCANPDRRAERLSDPFAFFRGYFPRRFTRPFCRDQEESVSIILDCARYNTDEIVCAPRGDWKTETLKHLVVYMILNEVVRFPVWIGATNASAFRSFKHIKTIFYSTREDIVSPEFRADFPELCVPIAEVARTPQKASRQTFGGEPTDIEWKSDLIVFPTISKVPGTNKPSPYGGMMMTYRGLDGEIRGLNEYGIRPGPAFCDDLETAESARMEGQIQTRESLLDNDIGGLGTSDPIARIVLSTVQNRKCLTWKKLRQWGGKTYRAVDRWPETDEAISYRDEYIERRKSEKEEGSKEFTSSYDFYEEHQKTIEEGLEMGNPYNRSEKLRRDGRPIHLSAFQRVLDFAADKGWKFVNAEIQNDPDEEDSHQKLGLTALKVASSMNGLAHNEVPPETSKITVGLDLGNYRSHWVKVAWFGNGSGAVIDYGILETSGMVPNATPAQLTQLLVPTLTKWRNDMLAMHAPDLALVDSGSGTHSEAVYEFIRQAGGVFAASKGFAKTKFRMGKNTNDRRLFHECYATRQDNEGLWLYDVNVEYWKNWIHERFSTPVFNDQNKLSDGALSLYSHESPRHHLPFGQHIVAEELVEFFVEGKGLIRKWTEHSKNNHWLDAIALAAAAGGCVGVRLIPRTKPPEEIKNVPTKKRKSQPPRFRRRSGGWVPGARKR